MNPTPRELPTRFGNAGQVSFERHTAETDATEPEAANKAPWSSANLAAIAHPVWVFAMHFAINH
jgi:hypothetical protein